MSPSILFGGDASRCSGINTEAVIHTTIGLSMSQMLRYAGSEKSTDEIAAAAWGDKMKSIGCDSLANQAVSSLGGHACDFVESFRQASMLSLGRASAGVESFACAGTGDAFDSIVISGVRHWFDEEMVSCMREGSMCHSFAAGGKHFAAVSFDGGRSVLAKVTAGGEGELSMPSALAEKVAAGGAGELVYGAKKDGSHDLFAVTAEGCYRDATDDNEKITRGALRKRLASLVDFALESDASALDGVKHSFDGRFHLFEGSGGALFRASAHSLHPYWLADLCDASCELYGIQVDSTLYVVFKYDNGNKIVVIETAGE